MVLLYVLLGLVVSSFLNVCIDRLPERGSIVSPPSHCPACGRRLAPLDLIPLFSFLFLRGRCRYCGAPIPRRVLVVEATTGLLFVLLWYRYGLSLRQDFGELSRAAQGKPLWLLLATLYTCFFIVIFFIDLEHHLVLNRVIYPAIVVALLAIPITPNHDAVKLLAGGALGFGLLFLIAFIYPAGMGMGDVKLATFIGLIVGFPAVLVALLISFVAGGSVGGGLLLTGLKGRKDPIPFAPFLVTGGIVVMLYGQQIIDWYVRCLL
ncbi:MAG: prepilin peptidase [Anaerolineales bacterium]|nr:prepilin peptidase [Anaerolineales bacterium]